MKTFRPLILKQDIQNCLETFIQVFNAPPWNDQWSEETARDYLLDYANRPSFQGFAGEEDGKAFGYIIGHTHKWWSAHEFWLDEMFIAPNHQRQGLGTFMLEKTKDYLLQQNIHRVILLTSRNTPASSFYRKNGFHTNENMILMSSNVKTTQEQ